MPGLLSPTSKVHFSPLQAAHSQLLIPVAAQVPALPKRTQDTPHHAPHHAHAAAAMPARLRRSDIEDLISAIPLEANDLEVERAARDICTHIGNLTQQDPVRHHLARALLFDDLDLRLSQVKFQGMALAVAQEDVAGKRDAELALLEAAKATPTPAQRMLAESDARSKQFATPIRGQGAEALPPARTSVTTDHVHHALAVVLRDAPAGLKQRLGVLPTALPGGLYERELTNDRDDRFNVAVKLQAPGRELLRNYYERKYHADIVFFNDSIMRATEGIADFIRDARRDAAGGDMRRAQFLGHAGGHGSVLVYMREGRDEALLWFDSMGGPQDMHLGAALAQACAPLAVNGKPIQVFQHVQKVQHDWQSCWAFSMKASVMMTGRQPDGHGGFNGYMVPGVVGKLGERRLKTPSPDGVQAVWALPDVAKISQYLHTALAHAGEELDEPLDAAKQGVTMRKFLEKYTYTRHDGSQVLDYMRQKGERLAEIVEIEAWSQEIGKALGAQAWGPKEQNEFAEGMKTLVRGKASSVVRALPDDRNSISIAAVTN